MRPVFLRRLFVVYLLCMIVNATGLSECTIVTTFYPMYVLTSALTDNAENITVKNMVSETVGCLHDYSLSPRDVALLERADIVIANGGGMEQFLSRVAVMRPDLPIIDASDGIKMQDSWEEGLLNAHVWLSPQLTAIQVQNITLGLSKVDPSNAEIYEKNAKMLCGRLDELDSELKKTLQPCAGCAIITFHEAFNYFAEAYGIEVAGVIAHEPGENPSTREIAKTCDLVKHLGIRALFTEPQYPAQAAETIARETGAKLYQLDTFVSGDGSFEGYEATMRKNASILLEALAP